MAVIKNGKISGKIGRYVYRTLNGQNIIQTYSKNPNLSENSRQAWSKFTRAAKTGSKIYQQTKTFALDFARPQTYREIVSLLRASIYSDIDDEAEIQTDWALVPKTNPIAINKDAFLEDYLPRYPDASFSETAFKVSIPGYMVRINRKPPKGANYVEFFLSVFHTHPDMTYELSKYESGRLSIVEGFQEQNLTLPLEWMENIDKNGIVYVCFGLSFFAQADSRAQINESRYNPSAMLGMWYKNVKS